VKELKADVSLHYLVDVSQDRMTEAVNLGVQRARQWCAENGILLPHRGPDYPVDVNATATKLAFAEEMKGYWSAGTTDLLQARAKARRPART
jgi:hypothetical protein